jgi:hypothetical protein
LFSSADCLPLNGLKKLDADVAEALARYRKGPLILNGLTTLDAETARALAGFQGKYLFLNGLTTLDAAAAAALAEFKGRLYLDGLTMVSADAAKAVASYPDWDGNLTAFTAFESRDSVDVAAAFATRKGWLALPNLKKISPKTLTALTAKQGVFIPLIETLELIPEPDGSPTEDFVIPEWLEEREKQLRQRQQGQ